MRSSLLALGLVLSSSAFAAESRRGDVIHHTAAAPEYETHRQHLVAVGVADTATITTGNSATALFSVGSDWIQTYAGVYQTKGSVTFAAGGAYKFTVAGNQLTGFHVGPGFTVGTVSDEFAFAIFVAVGGHYTFNDHLLFSVDAGPMVTHMKDNTNLAIRGLGPVLGLTIAYIF